MIRKPFNLKSLLLLISIPLFILICCHASSQKNGRAKEEKKLEQPRPVMEPQVDSLKKVLDEERKKRKP